ncbi:ATP-binding protein [Nocardioides sp.]|uniref:hybrid sensor histidine kinase/response regulator n=1 Tax=Nocardioides sp. TaxID=35761 RepID=UPI0035121E6F
MVRRARLLRRGGGSGDGSRGAVGPFSRALALLAVAALVAITVTAVDVYLLTRDLRASVQQATAVADVNVRTVTQTQRQLLRLEIAVLEHTPGGSRSEVDLAVDLTTQRAQETALPFNRPALRSDELADDAVTAWNTWMQVARPAVEAYLDGGRATQRATAIDALDELELRYNDIARVASVNRKVAGGRAADDALRLLDRTRSLLVVVGTSLMVGAASLAGLVAAARRIATARRRHQRELLTLNAGLTELAEVVRTTGALVVRTDTGGHIEWVNDAVARLLDAEPQSLIGLGLDDVDAAVMRLDAGGRSLEESLAVALPFTGELALPERGVHLTVVATPALDASGRHAGWNVVGNDITDKVRRRELLEKAREDAERVADEKSRFLATMSHEIRTPLNAVLGLQEALAHTRLDDDQATHLQQARVSAQHLLGLLDDALDFSALDAGRVDNLPVRCDVRAVIGHLTDLFGHEARERGLRLGSSIAADLPEAVLLDESHLRRVLVNLVGNALKYTDRGEVGLEAQWHPTPAAAGAPAAGELEVRVRDTGVGLDPDPAEVERLFEPFHRAPGTRDRTRGTGLGLWICRRVVDLMGGRLTLEPAAAPASGTIARVVLPTTVAPEDGAPCAEHAEHAEHAENADPAGSARPGPDPLSGLRVLVADDDEINRVVLSSLLRRLDIEPTVALGGGEARDALLAAGDGFDVALLDQRMPDLDGTEVAAEVRAVWAGRAPGAPRGRRPRLVVVTADGLPGDRERLLQAGMDDYLAKPVTLEALRGALERAVRTHPEPARRS